MSVAALTTALAYAPESMQALSFPERLHRLFRVNFKLLCLTIFHGQFEVTARHYFLI